MRLWPTITENKCFENNNNNVISLKPIITCHLQFFSKNVMNVVAFLSNKIKKNIYLDPKNEDFVKILWYFVVFLDFFFNIIKLSEPKFTISDTKSILIFLLLEAAHALHVQLMLVINKNKNMWHFV